MSDFIDSEEWADDPIRVLICDDHALFRRGLIIVLESEPDIEVMAEAADGEEAVSLALDLAPDVVLMDVRMPQLGGIQATRAINEAIPTAKIIVLTVSDEEDDLFAAVKAGASGYLLKETSIDEIADAVRGVMAGRSLISPRMASKLLTEFATLSREVDQHTEPSPPRLTDRERQVLGLVAEGKRNRDIADELEISENTAKNHVRNILEKLHLHSRMEAVRYAVRENLLETS